MTATTPKVSVCVIAYNQANFIGPCLDGLLAQDCTFDYEILVGDDGSTDGTAAIIAGYAQRHPDKVKAILHPKNLGTTRNYLSVHNAARGEYVAHLDGDDLAYPSKLRRQAEALDANPSCSACVHDMDNLVGDAVMKRSHSPNLPERITLDQLIARTRGYALAHSSKMYRRSAAITREWPGRELLDLYLHVENAATGPILGLREKLGAYRLHVGVSMGSLARVEQIHQARLVAIQRAAELGASPTAVRHGQVQAQFVYAVKFLHFGDRARFRREIRLRFRDVPYARREHRRLSLLRHVPWYLDRYVQRYRTRLFTPRDPGHAPVPDTVMDL